MHQFFLRNDLISYYLLKINFLSNHIYFVTFDFSKFMNIQPANCKCQGEKISD